MFDPSQEVMWALEELDSDGIVYSLEKIKNLYPREWELASMPPAVRKFYKAGPREEVK